MESSLGTRISLNFIATKSSPSFWSYTFFVAAAQDRPCRLSQNLAGRLEYFNDKGFLLPQPGREDDEWYSSKLVTDEAKEELTNFWLHWDLNNI